MLLIFLACFTGLNVVAQTTGKKIAGADANRQVRPRAVRVDTSKQIHARPRVVKADTSKQIRPRPRAVKADTSKNIRARPRVVRADTSKQLRPRPRVVRADTSKQLRSHLVRGDTSKQTRPRPRIIKADTSRPVRSQVIRKPVIKPSVADSIKKAHTLAKASSAIVATDSLKKITTDSAKTAATPAVAKKTIDSFYLKLLNNPYLKTTGKPVYLVIKERQRQSKDEMFYLLAALLLFLAFLRKGFSKYFRNIFYLFFQPGFRQKQTREQLQQTSFPSLLLNLFFILSGAAYISFIVTHYQLTNLNFLRLLIYSISLLLVLYAGKFFFLTFAGWVFDVKEATETYIFAVYLVNKILGVLLIPFTFIIAFSTGQVVETSITISLLLIGLLFIYRYLLSFTPVLRAVKVNALQFLFCIFAFEIVPLLLIYKTLMIYFNKSL